MDGGDGSIYSMLGSSMTLRAPSWLHFLRLAFPAAFPSSFT
jgi:hypothetical protein